MPPQYPLRFRAALACKLVNLDRVKFNDAVASGIYPCAPATAPGSARLFTEAELLPLFFFARLTEFGVVAGRAGRLACDMAAAAGSDRAEPATRITYVHGTFGYGFCLPNNTKNQLTGEVAIGYDPEHEAAGKNYPGSGRVIFTIDFYIKHVREMIADRIAREMSIIGQEEDEAG